MRVHLLRPESITPIHHYLERQRSAPRSYQVQKEFGALLLYREREYVSMHRWEMVCGRLPAPSPDSPFAPFDLTPDGARALAETMGPNVTLREPFDLFGLKNLAIAGLEGVCRPVKAHAIGWLLLSRLLEDCRHAAEAKRALRQARTLGEPMAENFDERVRQIALRARVRDEGEAFTRYWTTELAFCESERADALAGFDITRVPEALRGLEAFARRVGVGDDVCRGVFLRQMPRRERLELAAAVRAHAEAIDAWLERLGGPPFEHEAAAYFWLLTAAEEVAPTARRRARQP
jgi:hypothetical protein